MNKCNRLFFLLTLVLTLSLTGVFAVQPSGGTALEGTTSTAPNDTADSAIAFAGNVTELDISAFTNTQSWQGYFGNVSGTIQLADANDNVMYDWYLASPEGEVYASIEGSISWTNVQCFNFTAEGTLASDSGQRGSTSLYGMNLSDLEAAYGLAYDDVDGVDETFDLDGALTNNDGTHDLFYTNNLEFSDGECLSANIFSGAHAGEDDYFEEVLLYDPDTQSVIFTSLLEESDTAGFDDAYHDFEMLVLENGHGTDLDTTTYYFYVELE
ncbi:MAG: hypothetical protein OQK82_05035 [Candidatus Pacearchaeota archaeon]|nr:hypothetical protein [Candidatus Pacearchaeota archaeon]